MRWCFGIRIPKDGLVILSSLPPNGITNFLHNYFLHVIPLRCMVAETSRPMEVMDDSPVVLFTRYMDNTYLALCNLLAHVDTYAHDLVVLLQNLLYGVPFK